MKRVSAVIIAILVALSSSWASAATLESPVGEGGPSYFFWTVTWSQPDNSGHLMTSWEARSNPAAQVQSTTYFRYSLPSGVTRQLNQEWTRAQFDAESSGMYQVYGFQIGNPGENPFAGTRWNPSVCANGPQFKLKSTSPSEAAKVLVSNTSNMTLYLTPDSGQSWVEIIPGDWWDSGQNSAEGLIELYTGTNKAEKCADIWWTNPRPTISSVTPLTARPGDTVRITGNNFLTPDVRVDSLQVWLAHDDGGVAVLASVIPRTGDVMWEDTAITFRIGNDRPTQSGKLYVIVNNRYARLNERFSIVADPAPPSTLQSVNYTYHIPLVSVMK